MTHVSAETKPVTGASVDRCFAEQVERTPDRIALVGGNARLTYRELDRCANRFGRHLIETGVRPLDRVLLCLPRSVDAVIAMLAVIKVGATFVPLDPTYPEPVKRDYAAQSGARHAIVAADDAALRAAGLRIVAGSGLAAGRDDEGPDPGTAHDDGTPIYVMFTSGSTGRPKGVVVAHRGVVRLVRDTNYVAIQPDDALLLLSPITFDASTFEIWGALLNGARLAVYEDTAFDPNAIAALLERERVTILWLTAALFHLVVRRSIKMLAGLRVLLAGGDVLKASAVNDVLDAFPRIAVVNGYGPTENTTFTCCHVMTRANRPAETVPIGRPIAGTQVHVLDAALEPVADGCEGELFAGGRGVALGYLGAPEATRAAFLPDPAGGGLLYRTGDIVRRRPDGAIEFIGRRDRLTKIRGYRVSVDEVQALLVRVRGVEESVVRVQEDAAGEKHLAAVIQTRDDRPDMPAFVRSELRKLVPPFMIPDTITVCAQLPLNANGKVDQNRISGTAPLLGEHHG